VLKVKPKIASAVLERVYFLFKTSKMTYRGKTMMVDLKSSNVNLYDEIISVKTAERHESVLVQIYKEATSTTENSYVYDELLA
jgi:hypothetical protein